MGHSILIGWYHPGSKRFCYKDVKKYQPETRKGYTMPVYAVLERGMRKDLEAENKKLREVIKAALRISDLWTLKDVETMFEDEAKALETMKTGFEKALKEAEKQ